MAGNEQRPREPVPGAGRVALRIKGQGAAAVFKGLGPRAALGQPERALVLEVFFL